MNGIVEDILADSVKMNFNHPLAGCALHFSGKVVDIRKPQKKNLLKGYTEKELSQVVQAVVKDVPVVVDQRGIRLLLVTGVLSNPV